MQAAERKAKQSFLLAEIVDMQYSPDQFLEFCEKKKSSNIDEWTFEELEICTKEFKSQYKVQNGVDLSEKYSNLRMKPASESEKNQDENFIFSECEVKTVETLKSLRNELDGLQSPRIIVCNPEIVDPGFLSSKYFVFIVNTLPLNWIVKRKIEEFLWLRETLVMVFPAVFVPAVHKSSKAKPSDKGLYKRQVMYSSFLNNVLANPVLRNCQYFLSFLKDEDLKLVIKHSKKLQKPRDFSLVTTYEGTTCMVYSELLDQYELLQTFLIKSEKILNDVLVRLKKLIVDSVELSDSINKYAEDIQELSNCYSNIKHQDSAQILLDVQSSLTTWADYTMKSTKNVYEDLKLPINIFKHELLGLKELLKEREGLLSLYRSKDKTPNFRDFFAFFNYKCIADAEDVFAEAVEALNQKVAAGFAKKQEEIIQFHLAWGQLIANLAAVN